MGYFVGAGVSLALALVFFLVGGSKGRKAYDIASTETSSAAELGELSRAVAAEIGAGAFNRPVELKGRAVAVEPLRAEYSGTDCVWYECVATRLWEEEYWEEREGRRERRTRSGSDVVSRIRREPPFRIEDASGGVLLDPRGASVEAEKTFSRHEAGSRPGSLRVGSVSIELGALAGLPGGRRATGYRFEETCIPSGRELYVLGEASDSGGALVVRKPEKGRFLVSVRSEEAILGSARKAAVGFRVAAAVGLVVGAALAIAGMVARR
ncbi:MAG: hypothetical protein JXA15_12500 [Spirochaetales bacterium]|nr:hypothetical protein [Spirochaetales bacterium]